MTCNLFMDISKVAHGSFNALLALAFLYLAMLGIAIRRGRKRGELRSIAIIRHRGFGPLKGYSMQRSRIAVMLVIGIFVLTLGACTVFELASLPEGHPADSNIPTPLEAASMTLADPEPVDAAPARSEQWDKHPGEYNGRERHGHMGHGGDEHQSDQNHNQKGRGHHHDGTFPDPGKKDDKTSHPEHHSDGH